MRKCIYSVNVLVDHRSSCKRTHSNSFSTLCLHMWQEKKGECIIIIIKSNYNYVSEITIPTLLYIMDLFFKY